MFHIIKTTGYTGNPHDFKFAAKKASLTVDGGEIFVTDYDAILHKSKNGYPVTRHLTRRQMVFGVPSTDSGAGGFKGLVNWYNGEMKINMARAKMVHADEWIVDYLHQIINIAGWEIENETEPDIDRYRKL